MARKHILRDMTNKNLKHSKAHTPGKDGHFNKPIQVEQNIVINTEKKLLSNKDNNNIINTEGKVKLSLRLKEEKKVLPESQPKRRGRPKKKIKEEVD